MLTQLAGRATLIAAGGILLLGLGLGAHAGDEDFSFGDDLIGSLPVLYPDGMGGGMTSGPQSFGSELDVSMDSTLLLTGSAKEVELSVLNAYGTGWVEVEIADQAGEYHFVFHGDVILDLDRNALERGLVKTSLRPGLSALGGLAQVTWKGHTAATFVIQDSELELPYGSLLSDGTIDAGTVNLDLVSRAQMPAYLGISTYGSVAQIEQSVF
ncbi:MAG: hypothetical protein H8D72_00480 [Planctomycetes bacterium]|nr:hypothetical protein [Planctomycetota bacterium]